MTFLEDSLPYLLLRNNSDVLLAMCARQIGATLYTFNREDFTLIARYKTFSFVLL